MSHCATARCPNPATILLTAHGTGPITYTAAQTCPHHHRKHRAWVARAGPTVHETPLYPDNEQPATAQAQLF